MKAQTNISTRNTSTIAPNANPANYPRRVLLVVSGLSPQVVTETVFALAVAQKPAFVPTEVHLITTSEGAQKAHLSLLSQDMGWFQRLKNDYALADIAFDRNHIHVIPGVDGEPLSDIRTPQDNQAAADFITEKVRSFTADDRAALHVSVAGGRKTLGFYLGYALSLFGRPQDEMSHVLVSAPYESSFEFFYPTPYRKTLQTHDKRLVDASEAVVTLASIPYVSLRHGLPDALLNGTASFNETVAAARLALAPPTLVIDHLKRHVLAGDKLIRLGRKELALMAMFARRLTQAEPALGSPPKTLSDPQWCDWLNVEWQKTALPADLTRNDVGFTEFEGDNFALLKNRLHSKLRKALGPAAMHYFIHDGDCRPRRFSLTLNAKDVRFEKTSAADIQTSSLQKAN